MNTEANRALEAHVRVHYMLSMARNVLVDAMVEVERLTKGQANCGPMRRIGEAAVKGIDEIREDIELAGIQDFDDLDEDWDIVRSAYWRKHGHPSYSAPRGFIARHTGEGA